MTAETLVLSTAIGLFGIGAAGALVHRQRVAPRMAVEGMLNAGKLWIVRGAAISRCGWHGPSRRWLNADPTPLTSRAVRRVGALVMRIGRGNSASVMWQTLAPPCSSREPREGWARLSCELGEATRVRDV